MRAQLFIIGLNFYSVIIAYYLRKKYAPHIITKKKRSIFSFFFEEFVEFSMRTEIKSVKKTADNSIHTLYVLGLTKYHVLYKGYYIVNRNIHVYSKDIIIKKDNGLPPAKNERVYKCFSDIRKIIKELE